MQALGEHTLTSILGHLAETVLARHPSLIRELRIERVPHGIILHGTAISYYGKQVALQEVRQRYPVRVVANDIRVPCEETGTLDIASQETVC